MKNFRITNGFKKLANAELLGKASAIKNCLTNNLHFPSPVPSLAQLEEAINSFSGAVQKAESGDKQAIAVRNQQKEVLVKLLHRLGNYVLLPPMETK